MLLGPAGNPAVDAIFKPKLRHTSNAVSQELAFTLRNVTIIMKDRAQKGKLTPCFGEKDLVINGTPKTARDQAQLLTGDVPWCWQLINSCKCADRHKNSSQ
eukprot:g28017.t1